MSGQVDPEEIAALAVFAELGRAPDSNDTRVTAAEDEVEEVLRRLDLEALGLLAWSLDLEAPPDEVRETLMARLSADSTQEVKPLIEPPRPAGEEQARAPARELPLSTPDFPWRAAGRRTSPWAWRLAAALAVAALGLGGLATWLASELSSSRYQLARQSRDLREARQESTAQLTALRDEVASLERRRQFAAGPAQVVFALRPPLTSPQLAARGKLWVGVDHQHWQLEVAGLAPNPAGREYQVWFLVDGEPQSGGCFQVQPGRTGALADARMPAGTSAVAITLERAGGAEAPTTPVLLAADQAVEL